MTRAICIKCGAEKHGAWTPCQECRHQPFGENELADSLCLTDHYLSADGLATASDIIRRERRTPYVQELFDDALATVRKSAKALSKRGLMPAPGTSQQINDFLFRTDEIPELIADLLLVANKSQPINYEESRKLLEAVVAIFRSDRGKTDQFLGADEQARKQLLRVMVVARTFRNSSPPDEKHIRETCLLGANILRSWKIYLSDRSG